jgi:predicted nucleic acid-binding protein
MASRRPGALQALLGRPEPFPRSTGSGPDTGSTGRTSTATGSIGRPAQVLGEFASVMLDTMEPPLPPGVVYEQLQLYKKVFPIYPLTPAVSLEALRAVEEHSFRSFDAQIWATAKLNPSADRFE